jgi:hypothetical protein
MLSRSFFRILVLLLVLCLVGVLLDFLLVVQIIVVVVIGREVEFERGDADNLERGPALGAAQLIALVDVEFVDLDFAVAFRTGGHGLLGVCALRSAWQSGRSRARIRPASAATVRVRIISTTCANLQRGLWP